MRLLARATVSAVFALVLGIVCLAVPSAAVGSESKRSCFGLTCEGLDPAETICVEDARTIMSRHAAISLTNEDIGILELRYSPKCYSNWVRFTPWHGIQSWLSGAAAHATADGSPWIWRLGVAGSLKGVTNHAPEVGLVYTNWTSMVTADGVTCSSVSLYETEHTKYGGGERRSLGPYNAPCVS